jgi:hypothetical protein
VQTQDLLRLDRERLAALLAQQLATLPPHRQRAWAAQHLAPSAPSRSATPSKPAGLLSEIEAFCATSRDGAYVSWVDNDGWQGSDDEDGEEFREWTTLFADLMRSALTLTRSAQHSAAVSAYRMLLGLLREAGQTTDILGNHGAPEDAIDLELGRVIEAYARSLLATRPRGGVDAVLDELLPVAKQHRYAGGFVGLAKALDSGGRARFRARLTGSADAGLRPGESSSSDVAEGLIALARAERKPAEVLALKERFASGNAIYLKEVLEHYQRKKDWGGVLRLAELGVRRFGGHPEYRRALVRARDALGDRQAAQEARIDQFLARPLVKEFLAIRRRADAQGDWPATLECLLARRPRTAAHDLDTNVRVRLLLAEGQERELVTELGAGRRMGFDDAKMVAKYAVARLSAGADLGRFKKLKELQRRLRRERTDLYDWLRLSLQKAGVLGPDEYTRLAFRHYRGLIDTHLGSAEASRAAPAAHYGAILAELSNLLGQPALWTDFLGHLRRAHARKRLIWQRLRAEGCHVD